MENTLNLPDAEIDALWSAGNDRGQGFAVGSATMTPREAAEDAGYTVIRTYNSRNVRGSNVVCQDGDKVIAIADDNGPWAVEIAR